jgi:hypothetical protein
MGHIENKCWKKGKDTKPHAIANNYLEVLMDDEAATLEQLNRLCGSKHDICFGAQMPRRRLPMEMQQLEANAMEGRIT